MATSTSYSISHDPTGLIHKVTDGAPRCGTTDPLTHINTRPGHPDRTKLHNAAWCQPCDDDYTAALHAAIVTAGGRGEDCRHGYGWRDSCPVCD